MTPTVWAAFLVASVLISIAPGPGAVASMSSGARLGFWKGYWTAAGLQFGLVFQIALVAAGVGALLVSSPVAFGLIKWLGVAYLAWLGLRLLMAAPALSRPLGRDTAGDSARVQITRGFLVNCANPKAVVFMLAVLPQFLTLSAPLAPQYGLMALTMVSVDLLVMAVYIWRYAMQHAKQEEKELSSHKHVAGVH